MMEKMELPQAGKQDDEKARRKPLSHLAQLAELSRLIADSDADARRFETDRCEQWHKALIRLVEHSDPKTLAQLFRGDDPIPKDARDTLAELFDPHTRLLPYRLTVKASNQRARLQKKARLRAQAIIELEKERIKGASVEKAAENVAERFGISARSVLERADLRNPNELYKAHAEVAKFTADLEMRGITSEEFFSALLAALFPDVIPR
jgi:hypothetical protein